MSLSAGCDLLGPEVDDDNISIPFVLPEAPANVSRCSQHGGRLQINGDPVGPQGAVGPGR